MKESMELKIYPDFLVDACVVDAHRMPDVRVYAHVHGWRDDGSVSLDLRIRDDRVIFVHMSAAQARALGAELIEKANDMPSKAYQQQDCPCCEISVDPLNVDLGNLDPATADARFRVVWGD